MSCNTPKKGQQLFIAALTLMASVIFIAAGSDAADSEYSRQSLKNIKGLHVLVEDLTQPTKELGFTKEKITRDVKARVEAVGIRTLTQNQNLSVKGQPYLYLAVSALHNPSANNLIVYYFRIELVQNVLLERDAGILVDAPTWSIHTIGAVYRIKHVKDELKRFMDRFIRAYRSVNP